MGCQHKWMVISDVVLENSDMLERISSIDHELGKLIMQRKHILTVRCNLCGEIKQFVNKLLDKVK